MIEVGKEYRVKPEARAGKTGLIEPQRAILRQMLKNNGNNRVCVKSINGDYAQVAGWEGDAILGTMTVKLTDLIDDSQ